MKRSSVCARDYPLHKLSWLVVAAFCARLAWLLLCRPDPVSDFAAYRNLAIGLVEHGQFGFPTPTAARLPGYPLVLAGFAFISRNNVWLGASSALLSTCLVPIVHVIALQFGATRRVAWIAACLVAFNPTFVFLSPVLASEHLSTLLFAGAIALALIASTVQNRRSILLVGVGILMGFAGLTRGDTWLYLAVLLWIAGSGETIRRKLVTWALILTGIVVTASPWYWRNRMVLGPGMGLSPTAGFNFYAAHNDSGYGYEQAQKRLGHLDLLERDRIGWQLGLDYVRDTHVVGLAKSVALGTTKLYLYPPKYAVQYSTEKRQMRESPNLTRQIERFRAPFDAFSTAAYYLLCLCVLLTCWWWKAAPRRLLQLCTAVVFVNWLTCGVIFWGKPRYRYVSEVMFCLVAAIAVAETTRRVGLLRDKRPASDLEPSES